MRCFSGTNPERGNQVGMTSIGTLEVSSEDSCRGPAICATILQPGPCRILGNPTLSQG